MNELKLKEIQKASLNVLLSLNKICEELGLTYCLGYGTLLGAIRHNGFIPWDDDIDILMKREDYEILKEYFEKNEERMKPLKLCTRKNTRNYTYGIARLSDMRYKYITTSEYEKPIDLGVFIDIYPLDHYCNDTQKSKKLFKKVCLINKMYAISVNPKSKRGMLQNIIRYSFYGLCKVLRKVGIEKDVDEVILDLINRNTSCNDKYIGMYCWSSVDAPREKELFEGIIYHEFEGVQLPIPKNYHEYLTLEYGDYMELPPEEKRVPYHNYKIYVRKEYEEVAEDGLLG